MDENTAVIRQFITRQFNDDDLRDLCLHYFRDVYDDFTSGMGKKQMVRLLIEHCVLHDKLPDLLAALARERPVLYAQQFATPSPISQLPSSPPTYTPPQRNPRQIFLSHAHQDAAFAHRLAADLEAEGYTVWIAPDSIRPGEKWGEAIDRGLLESGIFIVVLTPHGVVSSWVRTETYAAIDLAHKGIVRFLPLEVEPCPVPPSWSAHQWVTFRAGYEPGVQRLLRWLSSDPDIFVHPKTGKEMVRIPAGPFLYGDNKETITLDEYWIDKTPVTNAEYKRFLDANPKHPVPYADKDRARPYNWDQQRRTYPADKANHPVVLVSWYDAKAYADWAGAQLPTEQQWEKAARGTDGHRYPWGTEWRENHCNTKEAGTGGTTPVGRFSPQGDSPYGCVDMAGNVWEWTDSWYDDKRTRRVVRGGSWAYNSDAARAAVRYDARPDLRLDYIGFRVVVARRPPSHP